jgi:hypothetical protein
VTFSADFNIDGTPDLGANYNLLIVDDGDEDTQ